MSVLSKFKNSIKEAEKAGILDLQRDGALIEAAKKVAKTMDDPEWPMINGKIDNVSPGVFLKYCECLGLTKSSKGRKKKQMTESRWKNNHE